MVGRICDQCPAEAAWAGHRECSQMLITVLSVIPVAHAQYALGVLEADFDNARVEALRQDLRREWRARHGRS